MFVVKIIIQIQYRIRYASELILSRHCKITKPCWGWLRIQVPTLFFQPSVLLTIDSLPITISKSSDLIFLCLDINIFAESVPLQWRLAGVGSNE